MAKAVAAPVPDLASALGEVRAALAAVALPLPVPGADEAKALRTRAVDQLDDYVLPRLSRLDAPLLAVIGGSTGAGKSTLTNAVVGAAVSRPGVLRPTTRSPVLVHHPDDAAWFESTDHVLPDLPRVTGDDGPGDGGGLRLVESDRLPPGLGLLDAPDVDSVVDANRELAARLLAAADMWVFVTSAARYADAVPWGYLRDAAARSAAVAVVLDRVAPEAADEVRADLARMMVAEGLSDSPLFTVAEQPLDRDRMLPAQAIEPLRAWLSALASDAAARAEVVRRTLAGAIEAVLADADRVGTAAQAQLEAIASLREDADQAFVEALEAVHEGSGEGGVLRGEVLARWQEFVGTGELLRNLESGVGRLRDRLVSFATGKPRDPAAVTDAVESNLETIVLAEAERADERIRRAWGAQPAGRAVLARAESTGALAAVDLTDPTRRLVREWQRGVLELIRSEGADRRTKARVLSFGVNGLGAALMIVVFAQTAGLTGAEIGIAGGTTLLAQRLLEAVFGDQAVRTLSARARADLTARVDVLFEQRLADFRGALDTLGIEPAHGRDLAVMAAAARSAVRAGGALTAGTGDSGGGTAVDDDRPATTGARP